MKDLAPVVLFVYNRPAHTRKTIQALEKNVNCNHSDLYIFSDGPKTKEQTNQVNLVREIISNIHGFKSVTIVNSEKNKGLANSIIYGVTKIINQYGKAIVLEDDLVTSRYFIQYMNEALNMYEDDDRVWSISGYTPNINIPPLYKKNIYLTTRGCSWGWATWKNRWETIDWEISDYVEFKKNAKEKKKLNIGGNDLSFMLDDQMNGRINSWAIRWVYNQNKSQKYTVYPIKSYIKNIGVDFSGTHGSISKKFTTEVTDRSIHLDSNLEVDEKIQKEFKKFYDLSIKGYIGVLTRKIGIYDIINVMRKKSSKKLMKP